MNNDLLHRPPAYTLQTRRIPISGNCKFCDQGHPLRSINRGIEVWGGAYEEHEHYVFLKPIPLNERQHMCPTHGKSFYSPTLGGPFTMCTCGPMPWIDKLMMGDEVSLYHGGSQYSIERVDRIIKQGAVIIDGNELNLPVVVLRNNMWFGANGKRIWDTGGPSKNDMRFEIREVTQTMRDAAEKRDLVQSLTGTNWDRKSLNQLRFITQKVSEAERL